MKGKLLIISYSFPPDNVPAAQRPYFMAKYFTQDGLMETIILTSKNALSSLGKSVWANIENLNIVYTGSDKKMSGQMNLTPVNQAKKTKKKFSGLMQFISREFLIPDKGIYWYLQAWKKAKTIISNNTDIKFIYSTSPLFVNHLVAYKVCKHFNIKWIADIRDFYYIEGFKNKKLVFRKTFDKAIEKKVVKQADALTFISDGMMNEYKTEYPEIKNKSYVIYNGFDENEFNHLSVDFLEASQLIIFYGGSFYRGLRSPKHLIDILEKLINLKLLDATKIEVRIAGNIPMNIFDEFKNYKVYSSLKLLGIISRKEVLKEMMKAHFLWLIIGNEKAHYLGFPVKGYEYIGARKHILAFTPLESEPARIINELSCGTVFGLEESDKDQNEKQMISLFEKFKLGYFNKPIYINPSLLKKYMRQYQAHELYNVLMAINKS